MELFTRPPIEVICYTAGFLDGGGSIYWIESQGRFGFALTQSAADRYDGEAAIRRLQSAWGVGRVSVKRMRRAGRNDEHLCWHWTVNAAKEVHFVLSNCSPYLHGKREAATKTLEYITRSIEAGKGYRWTPNEDEYILNTDAPPSEMAERLGRSELAISERLRRLGVTGGLRK